MIVYTALPQSAGGLFLTEGGLETDLIFQRGIDLPHFATFPLVESEDGKKLLRDYYQDFVDLARSCGTGVVFESATWRANPDWGSRLGFTVDRLDGANRTAVQLLRSVAEQNADVAVVVSGNLGPRGDGYVVEAAMSSEEAASYHGPQIASLVAAGADLVTALTMTYVEESIGIVRAAQEHGTPVVISFTVETDGLLPSGTPLAEAINAVDRATGEGPAYYMVNCAHPTHFASVIDGPGPWHRLQGVRANASRSSHAELDEAPELDRGDERDLAEHYVQLIGMLPQINVVGGCCGTDVRHLEAISAALTRAAWPRLGADVPVVTA